MSDRKRAGSWSTTQWRHKLDLTSDWLRVPARHGTDRTGRTSNAAALTTTTKRADNDNVMTLETTTTTTKRHSAWLAERQPLLAAEEYTKIIILHDRTSHNLCFCCYLSPSFLRWQLTPVTPTVAYSCNRAHGACLHRTCIIMLPPLKVSSAEGILLSGVSVRDWMCASQNPSEHHI